MIFNKHPWGCWINFTFKRLFHHWISLIWLTILSRILLTPSIWEWIKLIPQIITFLEQLILSFYISWGFYGTNQLVSVFMLYIMVNENLACSFSWGYDEITTVICRSIKSNDILINNQSYKVITPMTANQKGRITTDFKIILLLIWGKMRFSSHYFYYYPLSPLEFFGAQK